MMKILLTGPSGAGKTALASQLPAASVIHLDQFQVQRFMLASDQESSESGFVLYEGMPAGADSLVKEFLKTMDVVLLLEPAAPVRLFRCWQRDGWRNIFRWCHNEWCWRVICRPLIREHHNVRKIRWETSLKN